MACMAYDTTGGRRNATKTATAGTTPIFLPFLLSISCGSKICVSSCSIFPSTSASYACLVCCCVPQDEREISRHALQEDVSRLENERREAQERATSLAADVSEIRQELAEAVNRAKEAESKGEM